MLPYVIQLSVKGCAFLLPLKATYDFEAGVWENNITCVRVPGVCKPMLYDI